MRARMHALPPRLAVTSPPPEGCPALVSARGGEGGTLVRDQAVATDPPRLADSAPLRWRGSTKRPPADGPLVGPSRRLGRALPRSLLSLGLGFLAVVAPTFAQAPTPAPNTSANPLTDLNIIERVHTAIDKGLEYLAGRQRPDGAWADNNAVNALAALAFMGQGHPPGRGPYREVLERAKKFIVASQRPDGFIQASPAAGGTMYMHGLATLALAEMYGMDLDPQAEQALRKAVELIIRCQSPAGGWRYSPVPGDQDLSVTVMQIVALRAANNADVPVPEPVIQKAIGFVRSCNYAPGGFGYTAGGGPTPMMSAAGPLSLELFGQYDDPRIPLALKYITDQVGVNWGGVSYFYYFHYYAIQAQYQAGGTTWNSWHPRVREMFLARQTSDGSWDYSQGSAEAGATGGEKVYATAMACLVLEIYNHFLPAYQR